MDRRTKIILAVVGILVLIAILLLFLNPREERRPATPAVPTAASVPAAGLTRSGGVVALVPTPEPPAPPPAPPSTAIAVRQLAVTFSERYGSFSSEGNFVNLVDLMPLMTERYRRETETFVSREQARRRAGEFSGTTSTVVRVDVALPNGEESTQATARVLLQRADIQAAGTQSYAQVLALDLLKTSEGWFVDRARWEPRA